MGNPCYFPALKSYEVFTLSVLLDYKQTIAVTVGTRVPLLLWGKQNKRQAGEVP